MCSAGVIEKGRVLDKEQTNSLWVEAQTTQVCSRMQIKANADLCKQTPQTFAISANIYLQPTFADNLC